MTLSRLKNGQERNLQLGSKKGVFLLRHLFQYIYHYYASIIWLRRTFSFYVNTHSPIYLDAANSFLNFFLDTIGPRLQDSTHMKTP